MCDSIVVASAGQVWLAKNSDREPGEAQSVEWHPAAPAPASRHARRRCTHIEVEDRGPRRAVLLSRPAWMWGAEMGINESGVAIANEAVFTREPVAAQGLTGMDLLRLALERADTAREGLDVITGLLREYPQGGAMGHRNQRFRYHSSFLIADGDEAWALETAGSLWAARRIVDEVYTTSNVLSIGTEHERIHPEAEARARERGWHKRGDFGFAAAFADPAFAIATGGHRRRACTRAGADGDDASDGDPASERFATLAAALRSHGGTAPHVGLRMTMPCAHASWLPTRQAGQTTGSMIARAGTRPRVWMTGTSSPCLSVFKPLAVDHDAVGELGHATEQPDPERGLWWRHERLHRRVLGDYATRAGTWTDERVALEARGASETDPGRYAGLWRAHHEAIGRWYAEADVGRARLRPFQLFWQRQSRRDGLG